MTWKTICAEGLAAGLAVVWALGAAPGSAMNLPKTGQNLCYNAAGSVIPCPGTGQDGELQAGTPWPTPRFTDNLNGTVTDNLTGLVWLKDANCVELQPAAGITWSAALGAANTLRSGRCGLSDASAAGEWRLPNVNELESLIDLSQYYHPLPPGNPFLNVQWGYWTSTTLAAFPGNAEWVAFDNGGARGSVKSNLSYLWPVRGSGVNIARTGETSCWDGSGAVIPCAGTGQDADKRAGVAWPVPRFVDAGIGTVADRLTGLIWMKNADCFGSTASQDAALSEVKTVASGVCGVQDGSRRGDWRLPNRKELRSLLNYSQADGGVWLTSQGFANAYNAYYWSSDSYPNVVDLNWLPAGADPNLGDKWLVRSLGGTVLSSWVDAITPPEIKHLIPVRDKLQPALSWPAPAPIAVGTALGPAQLNASASVPGSFSYTPGTGSLLSAGANQQLSVTFTPNDRDNYGTATRSVSLTVTGGARITLSGLSANYDGTPKAASASTVPPGKPVQITYNGSSSAPRNAGSYAVLASILDPAFPGAASGELVIAPAALSVTALPQSKGFGSLDPILAYQYSGLVPADSAQVFSGALSRARGEAPGSYGITQGTLSAGGNYSISFVAALFTIDPVFSVTPSAGPGGSLVPGAPQSVRLNETASFDVTPAASYRTLAAAGCGGTFAAERFTTAAVSADCSVTAQFGLIGDLNGDSRIDISDAMRALMIAVRAATATAEEGIRGDVGPLSNGQPHQDGRIDIADALLILKKAIGMPVW
ncbi:hypothetical protein GMST_29070 [Geomonas silvestris]|uniref:Dockerin domain-containing protein n=1 Tax=Geomonas silvestris TaxID=2740184 RepID=A0A6V8MKT0_9BACT|nr:DUF1566 domain-containing protein [Geomonas silvestris]GFO60582.1 hypothetical protein GMST_29070 [Geomonas silvestris]